MEVKIWNEKESIEKIIDELYGISSDISIDINRMDICLDEKDKGLLITSLNNIYKVLENLFSCDFLTDDYILFIYHMMFDHFMELLDILSKLDNTMEILILGVFKNSLFSLKEMSIELELYEAYINIEKIMDIIFI